MLCIYVTLKPTVLLLCVVHSDETEAMLLELSRVVAERDALAAQIKADAVTISDRIQHATKQGTDIETVAVCFSQY